ncbi:MAG TPA: hypothetical protein VJ785_16580 [Anaerolineales bacterium]|nr:hypothetical protein [Anaerolineales bacterium]
MNDLLKLSNDLTRKRGLSLILTQDRAHKSKTDLIAHLIMSGPLFVISGDEWLPAFALPRIIRKQTTQVKPILSRLYTARASTCYRLLDSLAGIAPKGEPILVLEFLHTFYDDDIPMRTRLFKLRECCGELKRLSLSRPVIVMTRETKTEEFEKFMPALDSVADRTITLESETQQITQPALF